MEAQEILSHFRGQQEEFAGLVAKLVDMPSHTGQKGAINRLLNELEYLFAPFHPRVQRLGGDNGDLLRLTFFPERRDFLVMLAHVDTVKVEGFSGSAQASAGRLYGNGAYDMKSGIALFLFALKACRYFGSTPHLRLEVILTPDEEGGSPFSQAHLLSLCRNARAVLLPEPCCPEGGVKTRRKAIAEVHALLQGKAAHSGLAPDQGLDANRALAKLIDRIDELAAGFPQLSFNPGVISGGSATNIVAAESILQGEIRTFSNSDLRSALDEIAAIGEIDGVSIAWQNRIQHPALEPSAPSQALFHLAGDIMAPLDYALPECASGGASDGSTLAAAGIPVLDGIGMKGGNAHAAGEYVELADFPYRAFLLFRLIEELA